MLLQEWANRADVPSHVVTMLNNFPHTLHPMAQLSAACNALSTESLFAKGYSEGMKKSDYWEVSSLSGIFTPVALVDVYFSENKWHLAWRHWVKNLADSVLVLSCCSVLLAQCQLFITCILCNEVAAWAGSAWQMLVMPRASSTVPEHPMIRCEAWAVRLNSILWSEKLPILGLLWR